MYDDVIRIKFKSLSGNVIFTGFTVRVVHGPGFRPVIVNGAVTVQSYSRRAGFQLQHMRFVFDFDILRFDISGCLLGLETIAFQLNHIDVTGCDKLSGRRVVNHVVAFKCGGDGFAFLQLVRQIFFRRFNVAEQFFLLLRQSVCSAFSAPIFYVVKNLRACIRM